MPGRNCASASGESPRSPRVPGRYPCENTSLSRTRPRKVSLRATDDRVDVSRIARAQGGGGHRRAAVFSTDLEFPELVAFLRAELAEQL